MKTFSVAQEALWGLTSFLEVVPPQEVVATYPELGVKAVIRMEVVNDSVKKAFEGSEMQKTLKDIDEKVKVMRAELIAPYEGKPIPPDQDALLGGKLKEQIEALKESLFSKEMKEKKIDFELSDEKGEMLTKIFTKYAANLLVSKQMILLIAKEIGIEE